MEKRPTPDALISFPDVDWLQLWPYNQSHPELDQVIDVDPSQLRDGEAGKCETWQNTEGKKKQPAAITKDFG